ncbi:hypothetical protein Dimus_023549 [Dionaea muscipula]
MGETVIQPVDAVMYSAIIMLIAHGQKAVNLSGAYAGLIVLTIHFIADYRYAAMLVVYFFTSSAATKFRAAEKRAINPHYFTERGRRNWIQVLYNSGIATVLAVLTCMMREGEDHCLFSRKPSATMKAIVGGIIGHYSCRNGDTWSSELGILSDDLPRLFTTMKRVKRGTNGAITKSGLYAAVVAGFMIGLTYVLYGLFDGECSQVEPVFVIVLSALLGLCGSQLDSLLGATLQYSGYCRVNKRVVHRKIPTAKHISGLELLGNDGVNVISTLLTTGLACIMFMLIF